MNKVNVIKQNLEFIGKTWIKYIGTFASILSLFFLFWTWDDIRITSTQYKCVIIILLCVLALILAILWTCIFKRTKTIWESPSGKIKVCYSDIMKDGFDKLGVSFMEQEVTEIKKEASSDFELVFADGSQVEAKTVIYAAGATPRRANIPGEQEYAGKGVSYCAICDGSFYRGKSVAVLGGGDTALDDAVYLADVAEKVYVIHRRKEFRGAAVTVAKLREKENVIFVLEHQVKEIIGEQKVTGVVLEDAAVIDVNGVFVAYGAVPQTDLLKKFAVLDDSGYVRAGETGETALEGLYVAGDARTKKLRQVVTAVSDGANAATAVAEYLK